MNLGDFDLNLKKDFGVKPSDESVILISVVRDELLLLEYFIQHYVDLGVTHFIFVDNDSEDGTVEYLLSRDDINSQVYHTIDSYSGNEYGLTWVNDILDNQCKNKWCLVVDVDELLMPKNGENLVDIRNKMKKTSSNVLPTCLIDFYPENFNSTEYKKGESFYSHSNYYDKFVEDDLLIYPGEGGELVVKGGVRHRVFGTDREPVCLTKKSFFKYDFFDTHYLDVGMHWILPKDFSDWGIYDNWDMTNQHIKYYPTMCVLGHFKFIKPNIFGYFKKRVVRNQDWGDSDEYRNYLQNFTNSVYKEGVSVLYESSDKIYEGVFDDGINRREFTIIISDKRHGTTTLCEKLNLIPQSVSLFEAFNPAQGRLYKKKFKDLKTEINEVLDSAEWTNKKYVSFKIFNGHGVNLEELFTCGISLRVIFLRRKIKDSYDSLVRAMKSGNWGTTPDAQITEVGCTGYIAKSEDIPDFKTYSVDQQQWFIYTKKLVEKYKIPHKEVWFGSAIHKSFDCRNSILGDW